MVISPNQYILKISQAVCKGGNCLINQFITQSICQKVIRHQINANSLVKRWAYNKLACQPINYSNQLAIGQLPYAPVSKPVCAKQFIWKFVLLGISFSGNQTVFLCTCKRLNAWGLNLKERYNFLAVTQEWPIIESTGSITTQLHSQPFKK